MIAVALMVVAMLATSEMAKKTITVITRIPGVHDPTVIITQPMPDKVKELCDGSFKKIGNFARERRQMYKMSVKVNSF